ncbi:hypothetical protein, partial [Burkholderia stagnalis]|uniref:hypothetical protein n=1 Tax=Burkholderia stagnalis TaxID=1503054 RepID=UPI0011CEF0D8
MSDDGVKNAIEDAKSTVELVGAIVKVAGDHPDVKAAGSNLASLSECLCVRHKLMAKEPRYATQTQG